MSRVPWFAVLRGWASEDVGDIEGPGAYFYIYGGIYTDEVGALCEDDRDLGEHTLTNDEAAWLAEASGFIVHTCSRGFVTVERFDCSSELDIAWERCVADCADAPI